MYGDIMEEISNWEKKYENFSVDDLEVVLETMTGAKGSKGVSPNDVHVDDGNDPSEDDGDQEEEYTDEMFEKEFAESGL